MRINLVIILSIITFSPLVKGQNAHLVNCSRPREIIQKEVFVNCIDLEKDKFDYRNALVLAKEGMKKFPYSYNLRLKKALILANLGNTSAAEKELIGLIRLYPHKQELHNYLGRIFYDKDRSKALLALLMSISINPNNEVGRENIVFVKRLLEGHPIKTEAVVDRGLSAHKIDDFSIVNYRLESDLRDRKMKNQGLEKRLNLFFESLGSCSNRKEGFFWEYYVPKYIDIYKNNLVRDYFDYIIDYQ